MKNKVLNYKDWFRAVNESNLSEDWSNESNILMEADVPVKNSVWAGKEMAKDEKYFRYWKGIMRSKVKFEITDVPMAKGGKYEATDDCLQRFFPHRQKAVRTQQLLTFIQEMEHIMLLRLERQERTILLQLSRAF